MDIFDVPLTEEDYERITKLDRGEEGRQGSNPATMERL